MSSGDNPSLIRLFQENPGTLAITDVTSANPGDTNIPPSILGTIVVLGVVSATLMMILIIISIAYAKKRYHKRTGHYKRHHMYDLPKYMVKPPPLPPRKVFPLVNKSTFLQSSSKEILITAAESTFVLKNDYGQGGHTPGERYCKNDNSEIQPDLSRHMYKNTMAGMSDYKNETHGPVLANTQIPSSITEQVSEPITSQIATSDPQTNGSTSKELSTYEQAQLHTAESPHFDTAADHENTCDHESYTEHQPYERSYAYQDVQPCDSLLRLNKEAQSQDSVLSDASKNEFDDNSGITEFTDSRMAIENAHDHESGSEHEAYEKVYSYEKVQPCDVEDVLLHLNKEVQSHDPPVLGKDSNKDSKKESSGDSTMEFTAPKLMDSGTTAQSCESDSEHESYEQVYSYEKVQSCDVEDVLLHLNKEVQSHDPTVLGKDSKKESSGDSTMEFTAAKLMDSGTTAQSCESDSEHESYEQVYSYEKVQSCDIEDVLLHLNKEVESQDPSGFGKNSKNESNKGSGFRDLCTTIENSSNHESDSEHESYEKVCPYEKVQPCDVERSLLHLNREAKSQDSSVLGEASKSESNDNSAITEFTDLFMAIENICDHESDFEHESYEEVYSYEMVQSCDVDKLIHNEAHQQAPSVHCEASIKDYNDDSEGETSPAESHDSYEQVWSYEKIYHCDLPQDLEELNDDKNCLDCNKN